MNAGPQGGRRFDVILDNVLNHPPKAVARVLAPMLGHHPGGKIALTA